MVYGGATATKMTVDIRPPRVFGRLGIPKMRPYRFVPFQKPQSFWVFFRFCFRSIIILYKCNILYYRATHLRTFNGKYKSSS